MNTSADSVVATQLAPVSSNERIQALDVVRGFALIGILMMNVEFFNRAMNEIGGGIKAGLTGTDWLVAHFVAYFVIGKFWTTFSLLFGMGFAVMLTRAERAQRPFLTPYMRRIAGLATFGAVHFIFIWAGDILFSYSVGATALLVVLYGRPSLVIAAAVLSAALGLVPHMGWSFAITVALTVAGLAGMFVRGERQVPMPGGKWPLVAVILLALGLLLGIAGIVMNFMPKSPLPAKVMMPAGAIGLIILATLAARVHHDKQSRPWRLAVGLYVFAFTMGTIGGGMQAFAPRPPITPAALAAAKVALAAEKAKPKAVAEAEAKASASASAKAEKPPKTPAEELADRAKGMAERMEKSETETRIMSKGTYAEAVKFRAEAFVEHAPEQAGFAVILIAMFMLGYWFVRAGVMENTRAHLPLFRKLATYALPFGVGLGLLGAAISTEHVAGVDDAFGIAEGLLMLGNLPACLGYVSLIIVMLHSDTIFSNVRVLAPFGRMALTNYLTQSVVGTMVFYGYGLGHWGASRSMQFVFVLCVVAVQIPFSHWWLARFRYGPMEWLWRGITYWRIPEMRLAPSELGAVR